MNDRALLRWGSWAAIAGGLITLVANVIHPRPESFDDQVAAEMTMVSGSDAWIGIHLAILLGVGLITFALFALARSMKGGRAEGAARVALGSLLITTPVIAVTVLIDGYGLKSVADAATGDPAMLPAMTAMAHIAWAIFMGTAMLSVGITPVIFGWAVTRDGRYPAWMGWVAILAGAGSIVAGLMGTLGGSSQAFWLLFAITSGVVTLWLIGVGFLLASRAREPVTVPDGVATRGRASSAIG